MYKVHWTSSVENKVNLSSFQSILAVQCSSSWHSMCVRTITTTTRVGTTVRTAYTDQPQNPTNQHGGRHAGQDFYPGSLISLQRRKKFMFSSAPRFRRLRARTEFVFQRSLARSLVVPCCVIGAQSPVGVENLLVCLCDDWSIPRPLIDTLLGRLSCFFFLWGGVGGRFFLCSQSGDDSRKIYPNLV